MKTHAARRASSCCARPISRRCRCRVVRDHHERIDGSGYPEGLLGAQVQEFPRIAAVADVYDAVTSERVYKPAAPPHVGVRVDPRGLRRPVLPERRAPLPRRRHAVSGRPRDHAARRPRRRRLGRRLRGPDCPTVRVLGPAGVEEFAVDMAAGAGVVASARKSWSPAT